MQEDFMLLEQKDTSQEELIINLGEEQEDKEILEVPDSFYL